MAAKDDIRRLAAKHAERSVYSLQNPYLDAGQKLEVELWFQFPGDCMKTTFIAFALATIFVPITWPSLVVWPLLINIGVGLANWFAYKRRFLYLVYLTVFHNLVQWIVTLSALGVLLYSQRYLLACIVLAWELGILALFEVHMVLYSLLAGKYGMHPKYAFFKKYYGYTFPFEDDQ
jgi:hypothetical protein